MKTIKNIIILISITAVISLFYSCLHRLNDGMQGPGYSGVKFKKIMVLAVVKDLAYKKAYEYNVVNSLKEADVNAIPSMDIFAPNKDYTEKEMIDLVNKNNIDGILTLKYTGTKIKTTVYGGYSYYQYYYDGEAYLNSPSYVEKHKIVNVECSLFSASSGKCSMGSGNKDKQL